MDNDDFVQYLPVDDVIYEMGYLENVLNSRKSLKMICSEDSLFLDEDVNHCEGVFSDPDLSIFTSYNGFVRCFGTNYCLDKVIEVYNEIMNDIIKNREAMDLIIDQTDHNKNRDSYLYVFNPKYDNIALQKYKSKIKD